jgi:hypothetical protein
MLLPEGAEDRRSHELRTRFAKDQQNLQRLTIERTSGGFQEICLQRLVLQTKQKKREEKAKKKVLCKQQKLELQRMNSLFLSIHCPDDHCYLSIQTEAQEEEAARQREVQKPKAKSKKENRKQEEDSPKEQFSQKMGLMGLMGLIRNK